MSINIVAEYKTEIQRLRIERDIVYELLVDQEQYNNISREVAEDRINREVFQRMQREGAV